MDWFVVDLDKCDYLIFRNPEYNEAFYEWWEDFFRDWQMDLLSIFIILIFNKKKNKPNF